MASVVEFNPDLTNGVEINEDFKKVYNVNMNGHSAESYTVVWLFKTAIEKAGSTDGAAVRDALAALSIDGAFEGGRKIVLPYSKIEFAPEYEIGGAKHYRDNTYASVAIAQVQDQEWKTVWPFEFASSKIQEVTLLIKLPQRTQKASVQWAARLFACCFPCRAYSRRDRLCGFYEVVLRRVCSLLRAKREPESTRYFRSAGGTN